MAEVRAAAELFWLRRAVRRRALRALARECAGLAGRVHRRAAELRAGAAQRRLERLRAEGAGAGPAAGAGQRALQEAERVLAELTSHVDARAASQVDEQPAVLKGGKLMQHQLQGLRWLVALTDNQMSGILADDMGLGKTVQALAFLGYLAEHRAECGPHLILVPFSMLSHWVDEFTSWLPHFHFVVFRGAKRQMLALRQEMVRGVQSMNVVLTTFETLVAHHAFLSSFPWFCMIADEGHRLKNVNTRVSRLCHDLPCRHRLLLTGTPVQNSLGELWALLSFVAPRAFGSLEDFRAWFALPPAPAVRLRGAGAGAGAGGAAGGGEGAADLSEEEELSVIQRLHSVLRPFLLRRTKELVLADLPEKQEVVIWVPVSAWQQALYGNALRRLRRMAFGWGGNLDRDVLGAGPSSVMALRKAVNHPYHFLHGKSEVTSREDNIFRASGKFELLDRILPRLLSSGHKVLIFAQMTSLLDLLGELLSRRGLRHLRLDGSMSLRQRRSAMHTFRAEPDIGIFLLTTRAGGIGLNLQVADTVILFDSDWNPQVDAQAMDRAHRIGQRRRVLVIRLVTPTTLDRGLLARLGSKLDIERKVISAGNFHHEPGMEARYASLLRDLVRDARRCGAAPASAEATPLAEVSRLLARSPEERAAFDAADDALLGPPAAGEGGGCEGAAERLERCGRLMAAQEVPHGARRAGASAAQRAKRRRGAGPGP